MKEQERFSRIFIFFFFLAVLFFIVGCRNEAGKVEANVNKNIQLEIKETTVGSAIGQVTAVYFRLFDNREAEFDMLRNRSIAVSKANLQRKQVTLSEEDVNEIKDALEEMKSSNLKDQYPMLPRAPGESPIDNAEYTVITFTGAKGEIIIDIPADSRAIGGSAYEKLYPKSLQKLFRKIYDIRIKAGDFPY